MVVARAMMMMKGARGTRALAAARDVRGVLGPAAGRSAFLGGAAATAAHSLRPSIAQHTCTSTPYSGTSLQQPARRSFSSSPTAPQQARPTSIVIPTDHDGVIDGDEAAVARLTPLLSQPTLVVTRQMEMLNIFLGFEQANRYALVSPEGEPKGYIAETEQGLGNVMQRQFFRNHRPFTAHVLDGEGKEMLVIRRAFKWLTSKTSVSLVDPETGSETLVGEVRQRLTVYRRKYDLFVYRTRHQHQSGSVAKDAAQKEQKEEYEAVQFASIDGGLWAWDFVMVDADGEPLGAVSRNFRGFGREIFTDTGQYVVAFDPSGVASPSLAIEGQQGQGQEQGQRQEKMEEGAKELVRHGPARALTLDERAVALATAVSCDVDYFSQHSQGGIGGHGGGMMPLWMMGSGSSSGTQGQGQSEGQGQSQDGSGAQGGGQGQPQSGHGAQGDYPTRQDSSGVHAPTPAPGADGGWGPAIGTGIGYGMLGGGSRQAPDDGGSASSPSPPPPSSSSSSAAPPPQQQYGEQDYGQGQEEVWGDGADPWAEPKQPHAGEDGFGGGGGGGGGGWSLSDFLPGGGDGGWGE